MLPEQMFVEINVVGIIRVRTDSLRKNVVRIIVIKQMLLIENLSEQMLLEKII
jgi:hypothetical protein